MRPRWWERAFCLTAILLTFGFIAACTPTPQPTTSPTPTPTPSASTPAPLPPATGVDGEAVVTDGAVAPDGLPIGEGVEVPDVQPVPDAGSGSGADLQPPTDEGVGGEVYVTSPAFKGSQRLNAGAYYPSGSPHWGWDVGINRGTPLFAARAGLIVGENDGVPNHPIGWQYAIPNSASNWQLLCANVPGIGPSVLYYQHQSPGISKLSHVGETVKAGQRIGTSGNTGNSTGDHLHLSSSRLPSGWTCNQVARSSAKAEYLRYDYLRTPSRRNFAPALFWTHQSAYIVLKHPHAVRTVARRKNITAKKLCTLNPGIRNCTPSKVIRGVPRRVRIS